MAKTGRGKKSGKADRQWANRIIAHGEEDPEQLLANPKNFRIHTSVQESALEGSLDVVGWVRPVLVNQRTGCVLDGHLRVKLALTRGERAVPVDYVDLSENEEAIILAALDAIAAMAGTDEEQLKELIAGIKTDNEQLKALLAGMVHEDDAGGGRPEIAFSSEIKEENNFVVLFFDNAFDWNVAQEHFGIAAVKAKDSRPGYERKGLGRVIDGKKYLAALGKKKAAR